MKKENREKPQDFNLYLEGDKIVLESNEPVTTVEFTREQAAAFAYALEQLLAEMNNNKQILTNAVN